MKLKTILLFCFSLLSLSAQSETVQADYRVVPLPQTLTLEKGQPYLLTSSSVIARPADKDLQRDAEFLRQYVEQYTGIRLTLSANNKGNIRLELDPKIENAEGYVIRVSQRRVTISGRTAAGVFYGVQTLRKSLRPQCDTIALPAAKIAGAPRFAYRGMMLDCARHFFPVQTVKQYIDLLALHGMNVFHWHLTDDQGWRLEIKRYPRLTEVGSKRKMTVVGRNTGIYDSTSYGGFYTQAEAREIVRYAAERYITVIPEIDMPGHTQGVLAAYPELGCTGGPYEVWPQWGVSPDVLCLGNEKIYSFCENVLTELMDIFPSKLIHIGGDETPTQRWEHCEKCKQLAEREHIDIHHLQNYFTKHIESFVESRGRRIIGWDEVLQSDSLSPKTVIMSWRGAGPGLDAAAKGHDVIMAPTSHCYFDYYQTASGESQWNEPLLIGGNVPIEKTYSFDPVTKDISQEAARHILGVQANLWAEYITCPALIQYQVLPRMGALSEVQWLQPGQKDFDDFKSRSLSLRRIYDAMHLTYNKRLWKIK